jgi:hypothetical protein
MIWIIISAVIFFLSFMAGYVIGAIMSSGARQDELIEKMDEKCNHRFSIEDFKNHGLDSECMKCKTPLHQLMRRC